MWTSTLLLALLAQQPLPPGSSTALPAGHPPLDAPPRAPEVTSGVASPGAAIPAGHPPVASGPAAGAAVTLDELVRRLDATPDLKTQDRPFEYSVSIGQLYFAQGRHADALVFFEQGVKKAEPVRTFYLERRRSAAKAAAGAAAALGCESGPATTMDSLFQKAQEYARAKRADAAALCAGEALRGLVALEPDLGHARFLLKDPAGAMAAYERALALFDTNTGARYGRAALRLDTSSEDVVVLAEVKADLQRVVQESGPSSRTRQAKRLLERVTLAIAAGGVSRLPLSQGPAPEYSTNPAALRAPPPPLSPSAMTPPPSAPGSRSDAPPPLAPGVAEAFQAQPRTAETDKQVAELVATGEDALAKGSYQAALDSFKAGMPIAPENGRLRAGLAWSLYQLGRPTADRVWSVALQDPEAIARLSDTLATKGDVAGATALRTKLVAAVPAMASRYQASP